jgi:hypothetical protein
MADTVITVWLSVLLLLMALMVWALVAALKTVLRRNEYLTTLLAVGNSHGGKGTDAARAQVAAVRELKKRADKKAAGVPIPQKEPRPGLRLKQTTP